MPCNSQSDLKKKKKRKEKKRNEIDFSPIDKPGHHWSINLRKGLLNPRMRVQRSSIFLITKKKLPVLTREAIRTIYFVVHDRLDDHALFKVESEKNPNMSAYGLNLDCWTIYINR